MVRGRYGEGERYGEWRDMVRGRYGDEGRDMVRGEI